MNKQVVKIGIEIKGKKFVGIYEDKKDVDIVEINDLFQKLLLVIGFDKQTIENDIIEKSNEIIQQRSN
jgi:hypothetical protein